MRKNTARIMGMPTEKCINLEDEKIVEPLITRAKNGTSKQSKKLKCIYIRQNEKKRAKELCLEYGIPSMTDLFRIFIHNTRTSQNPKAAIDLSDERIIRPPVKIPTRSFLFDEEPEKKPASTDKSRACFSIALKAKDEECLNMILEENHFPSFANLARTYIWNTK